jgi:hypothetical protein
MLHGFLLDLVVAVVRANGSRPPANEAVPARN